LQEKNTKIVVNEKLVLDIVDKKLPRENHPPKELFKWLWLGKPSIGYDNGEAFVGKLTDYNAWLR
jgi:hypothetical protein